MFPQPTIRILNDPVFRTIMQVPPRGFVIASSSYAALFPEPTSVDQVIPSAR
jgi:hypothetical protein